MGAPALIISAIASAASGVVSYVGAQRQAKAMEYNAEAVQNQAEYNAQIERNNALAQSQQADFDKSVVIANKNRAIQEAETERQILQKKAKTELAAVDVKFGYGGTFNSYMDSLEDDAFEQELALSAGLADTTMSAYMQANEQTRMSKLYHQRGETAARNTLFSGQNQANNLRNQAGNTRTAGFASMIGSFAQAGSTAGQIQ